MANNRRRYTRHHTRHRAMPNNRGFTLLEMLLAIAIFSVISLSGWQIFKGLILAQELVVRRNQTMAELDYALLMIDQDFRQIADRGTRIGNDTTSTSTTASLFSGSDMVDSDDEAIALVRYGWQNPGQQLPRPTLQRVFYRLQDRRLERQFHYVLDPVNLNDEPKTQTLLTGVDSLTFRFFHNGQWQDELPDDGQFPRAIAIAFELEGFGMIERRYLLTDPWPTSS